MDKSNIKIRACKNDVAAEVEIPLELVFSNSGEWKGIENLLSSLYNAINKNLENNGGESTLPTGSFIESRPLPEQSVEMSNQKNHTQDEPTEYESLEKALADDAGWREVERLVVIIFYASNFGTEDVSRDDIVTLLKELGRDTLNRKRNLSNNLHTLQKYNWLMASKSGYYMTDEGIYRAKGILARGNSPIEEQE